MGELRKNERTESVFRVRQQHLAEALWADLNPNRSLGFMPEWYLCREDCRRNH